MSVAVVISTWSGNPAGYLRSLCESMKQHQAGMDYHLFLCANGMDYSFPEDLAPHFSGVFIRENVGFNLAAWDYAWRHLPGSDQFLFLQDDCRVLKDRWLDRFVRRFQTIPRCGLVGENLVRSWDKTWLELCDRQTGKEESSRERRVAAAQYYHDALEQWGISPGPTARHLTSVVHFTSRAILEEVDGYNLARTKGQAMAAEIGFSRKVEAKGYALVQLSRRSHNVIAHRQWPSGGWLSRLKRSIYKRFSKALGIREVKGS